MLDKAVKYTKEKRKPYRDSRRFDTSCRNHKGCPFCENNRTYQSKKEIDRTNYILKEDLLDLL